MGNDTTTIILAVVVGLVFFVGYMVIDAMMRKQKQSEELKERILGDSHYEMSRGDEALLSMEREKSDLAKTMQGILSSIGVNMKTAIPPVEKKFGHAGIDSVNGPVYYLFFQRILSVGLALLSIPLFLAGGEGLNKMLNMLLGTMLLIFAFFGPYLYLSNKTQKRQKVLMRSFPDALDLLLVCVESGLALDASLNRVCKELGSAHPDITREFNRTRLELALLNDRSQALMNLGDRTNLIPFRSLAAALIQTEKFGTNLTDTLRVLSDDYRQTRLLIAENKANRLPALITVPLIFMLMPAFLLVLLGPAYIQVSNQGGIMGGN